jgi:uncharacterized RDD family membrane protein YckC
MRNLLVPFGLKPRIKEPNIYADIFTRSLAAALDLLVLFVLFFDFFYWMDQRYFPQIANDFLGQMASATSVDEQAQFITQWLERLLIQLSFFGVAIVGCQAAFATTPGKWLIGIKIVRTTTHAPVSWQRFVLRFFAYIPACAPLMLGIIWAMFNKQRRGWHDYIADTVVLNLRPTGWYWNHCKRGFFYLKGKWRPSPVKDAVGEPPAEQRHRDGDKPV